MFNSFYESLPPIDLGKSRIIALLSGYVVYGLTFLGIIGLTIARFIDANANIVVILYQNFFLLFLGFSVGRVIYTAFNTLPNAYVKKTYKLNYNNLRLLKRGYGFQFVFAAIIFVTYFVKFFNTSEFQLTETLTLIFLGIFTFEIIIFFTVYYQIEKPLKMQIRSNFIKQQQNMYEKYQGSHFKQNHGKPSWDDVAPFKTIFDRNKPIKEKPRMTKEQEEAMVRSANVPVIDITKELDLKQLSTTAGHKNKKDQEEKDENGETPRGKDEPKISAF